MSCTWCREALSALLDGEDHPGERAEVAAHLTGCPGCRRYSARATTVTMLIRDGSWRVPPPAPDLAASMVAHDGGAAAARRTGWTTLLRIVLGLLGLGQVGLATNELIRASDARPGPGQWSGAGLTQLAHESSAWNLALAVGFFCVAFRPGRTRTLIPLVSTFVIGCAGLTALDAARHEVAGARLLTHLGVLLGLVVLVALARVVGAPSGPGPGAVLPGGPAWEALSGLAVRAAVTPHPAGPTTATMSVRAHGVAPHDRPAG